MANGNLSDILARADALMLNTKTETTTPAVSGSFLEVAKETTEDETQKEKARKYAPLFAARKKVGDFPDPKPDEENENAIFKTRYLRKGGLMLLVSTLGVGKSTFVSQGSECWARGLDFFGFTPARPLSIGVFETEDDDDEVADFRNNFRKGFADAGWTELEISISESGDNAPTYYPVGEVTADSFLDYLEYCQAKAHHDLIIINPAYDFIDGDISKQADVSPWKARLFALMEKHHFATLLVHHTNKVPTNVKERESWNTGTAAAYAGSGSMVLPSAARSVVFVRPVEKHQGVFEMIASKRGKRLGWKDGDGNPSLIKYIAHSDGYIFWRNATPEEVDAVSPKTTTSDGKPKLAKGVQRVIEICTAHKVPFDSVADYRRAAMEKYEASDTACDNWLNAAIDDGRVRKVKANGHTCVGLTSQFETDDE